MGRLRVEKYGNSMAAVVIARLTSRLDEREGSNRMVVGASVGDVVEYVTYNNT